MTAVRWAVQDSKARPCRRRGKKQSSGLFFSAWLGESRNVYRDGYYLVRTRTQFSMRKGSGTFFVYGRFAVAECNDAMKAPVGLSSNRTVCEADGGASPRQVPAEALLGTVSWNEQRQGITMAVVLCLLRLSPYIARFGSIAAYVRTQVRTHVRKKKGKFWHIGVFFRLVV